MSVSPSPVLAGWTLLDLNFLGRPHLIGAYLAYDGSEAALIEVGPTSTVENLLAGVVQAGVPLEALRHLVVTHIHLDHAGALGVLAQKLPWTTVYVHPIGAPHLADPSRLLASAARLYAELLDTLWGAVLPVPSSRIVALQDSQELRVAGRRLIALDTPGHARHHYAYFEPETGLLFSGDIAGVRMPGYHYVRPPTPPPELDLEAWSASLARLRGLPIKALCLTHFGPFSDNLSQHLDELEKRLYDWGKRVHQRLKEGKEEGEIVESLQRFIEQEMATVGVAPADYELTAASSMIALGYLRYWRKKQKAGAGGGTL